ncbi:hypothetical protein ACLB2K_060963 [Fragaria x ananassa]
MTSSPSTHRPSSPWTRPKKKPSSSTHPPLLRRSSLSRSTPVSLSTPPTTRTTSRWSSPDSATTRSESTRSTQSSNWLNLQGVNRADLEPMQTEIRPKDLSSLATFRINLGRGEYFTRVGVGSPVK